MLRVINCVKLKTMLNRKKIIHLLLSFFLFATYIIFPKITNSQNLTPYPTTANTSNTFTCKWDTSVPPNGQCNIQDLAFGCDESLRGMANLWCGQYAESVCNPCSPYGYCNYGPFDCGALPTPEVDCRCSNNISEPRCNIDNYCGYGYVEQCTSYPYCRDTCTCVLPTNTPVPPELGTCQCNYDFINECSVIESLDNCTGNLIPNCQYDGDETYTCSCSCVPRGGEYTCTWNNIGFGSCRFANVECDEGCFPNCDDLGIDTCGGGPFDCICPDPTGFYPTAFYEQCGEYCDPDSEYPYGSCLSSRRDDICIRPPSDPNGQLDCHINGELLDCWCCTELVNQIIDRDELNPTCGNNGIKTAIGCIPVGDKNAFLGFILSWAIGIAGGTSFLLIIYSGFLITTSSGDKRKLQAGKELLTAALSGMILLIFSVFILDLIGIRILKIPGI